MTRIVDTMVREEWVERSKAPEDNRRVYIRLTRQGNGMVQRMSFSSKDYVRRIAGHLPAQKIPRVLEALKLIVTCVEKELRKE